MNMNSTPGPWERRVNEDNSVIRIEADARTESRSVVAYVTRQTLKSIVAGKLGSEPFTNFANASLIAAAPDLAAAMEGLKPILDRAESNASGNPEWEAVSKRINAARAALAKARGEA